LGHIKLEINKKYDQNFYNKTKLSTDL
jgi:hypothetical protein